MKQKKFYTLLLSAAAFAFLVSCGGSKQEDPKEAADQINDKNLNNGTEKDADRLVDIYSRNLYEIRASENAAMNAASGDVTKLAGAMVSSHTKMNNEIQSLCGPKNIALPTDLSDDQRKDLDDLTKKSGLDYDKEYIKQMKNLHENNIKTCEHLSDRSDDQSIKTWAASALSEVRSHAAMFDGELKLVKEEKKDERARKKEHNTWSGKSDLQDGREDIHDNTAKKK
jgi:putative membrane protein